MAVYDLWFKGTGRDRVKRPGYGHGLRWQARWRDAADVQRKKNFATKDAAEAHLVRQREGPIKPPPDWTVADMYPVLLESKAGKRASTLTDIEQKWRLHVQPEWGHVLLADVRHSTIAAWIGRLQAEHSATTARRAWLLLRAIVKLAVRDQTVGHDPTVGIEAPVVKRSNVQPFTVDEVRRLAEACSPHGLVVWVLALTGMRFGEMAGLRVRDLDAGRNRLRVARTITEVNGQQHVYRPKNDMPRDVPVPAWLTARLSSACEGRDGDDPLLPAPRGSVWRLSAWHRIWAGERRKGRIVRHGARVIAGVPNGRVHDLRHTAATLAIRAGADVKDVQAMLGHESGAMTLDLYAHWFDDRLDDVAEKMGQLMPDPDTPSN